MNRFTAHNTDHQYNNSELAELNTAFEIIMADNHEIADEDNVGYLSWQDHVAEKLLASYDAGKRGGDLLR